MGCNRCNQPSCTCIPGVSVTPQPYYVDATCAKENHVQSVYVNQFAVGVEIQDSWNIPQCGGAAILNAKGIINIPVGAFLWHPSYGYFEIIAADVERGTISIQNPCLADNAPEGTQVPSCVAFAVGPPPCCEDVGQEGMFLKYDFTAPEVDACIDITLTTVDGLITGSNLQIGSGVYRLDEVKANNVVTICNDGEGLTPGTPVIAQNVFGTYQYPIIQLTVNGCDTATVSDGTVLVCFEGTQRPLTGAVGQILVLNDASTGEASYQNPVVGDISAAITTINNIDAALDNDAGGGVSSAFTGTINSGTTTLTSNVATATVTNASTTTAMLAMYVANARIYGNADNAFTDRLEVLFDLQLNVNGGGWVSTMNLNETMISDSDNARPQDRLRMWSGTLSVPASSAVTVQGRLVATWQGTGAAAYIIDNILISINYIGVAV